MAGGALVPFEVSPGRTVMVPDYLVPQAPGAPLQLPEAGAPPPPDPNRIAANDANPFLAQASPDYRAVLDAGRAPPPAAPLTMTVAPPSEDAEQRRKRQDAERAVEAAKEAAAKKANPKNLKPVPKADPRRESNVIAQTAEDLYKKPAGGGGAPPPVDPQNLHPVVAEIKQERMPGQRLLPEQAWRYGFAERPNFPDEIDPNAEQPTWGTEEPVRRPYLTPLERGAKQAAEGAKAEFERSEEARKEMAVAQRAALAEEAAVIDSNLVTIAERRKRIASLQSLADERMESAKSMEPRTRAEIWGSQGNVGRGVAILAAVLGGAAQGLRGGPNSAWDMIDNWVNETVEDDRYQYERAMQLGQSAKRDWAEAVQLYGDVEMAALESKNRKLANVMASAQMMMNDRQLDATAKERGAAIMAMAEEAYLANKQQLMNSIVGTVTKEEATLKPYGQVLQSATPKPTGGGGGGAAPGITGDKLKGLSAEIRGLAVKMPDGTFKFVRNPVVRADTQERLNSAKDMIVTLRQLQSLRADKSNTIPWSAKRGQVAALGAQLLVLDKSKNKMGTLDKGLLDFANTRFGKPEEFNVADETVDGKIQENINILESEVRKLAERELDNGPFELTEGGVSPDEVRD